MPDAIERTAVEVGKRLEALVRSGRKRSDSSIVTPCAVGRIRIPGVVKSLAGRVRISIVVYRHAKIGAATRLVDHLDGLAIWTNERDGQIPHVAVLEIHKELFHSSTRVADGLAGNELGERELARKTLSNNVWNEQPISEVGTGSKHKLLPLHHNLQFDLITSAGRPLQRLDAPNGLVADMHHVVGQIDAFTTSVVHQAHLDPVDARVVVRVGGHPSRCGFIHDFIPVPIPIPSRDGCRS